MFARGRVPVAGDVGGTVTLYLFDVNIINLVTRDGRFGVSIRGANTPVRSAVCKVFFRSVGCKTSNNLCTRLIGGHSFRFRGPFKN